MRIVISFSWEILQLQKLFSSQLEENQRIRNFPQKFKIIVDLCFQTEELFLKEAIGGQVK